jgi:uncharacterized protein YmfQ (DUF2313 family)
MGLTAASYIRMLKGLLPRGPLWSVPSGSVLNKLLQSMADELLRVDTSVVNAFEEADPSTSTAVLSEWERIVGLPDDCTGISSTLPGRRQQVVARLSARGGQNKQFFIDLAASVGFEVSIEEFDRFLAGSKAGDGLYNKGWIFAWRVNAISSQSSVFRAGAHAGDKLSFSSDSTLECLINKRKPAHTVVLFAYT